MSHDHAGHIMPNNTEVHASHTAPLLPHGIDHGSMNHGSVSHENMHHDTPMHEMMCNGVSAHGMSVRMILISGTRCR